MFKKVILLGLILALCLGAFFPRVMNAATIQPKAHVFDDLSPVLYEMALKAHLEATRKNEIDNPDILTIIDYSKPSYEKRMWIIRLSTKSVLHHTYVAHGAASGQAKPLKFSNQYGSKKSSLGVFKTGQVYIGKHGRSLNIHGLEKQFNSNAFQRRVVIHGSSYVGQQHAMRKAVGRSHGCPAVSYEEIGDIIKDIKNGTMLFIYYPDKTWLEKSAYV